MPTAELSDITRIVGALGYTLAPDQPHISGERFLMQAITTVGGQKYILNATDTTGRQVIIKATKHLAGQQEIEHERTCRQQINNLAFAYNVFAVPEELLHTKREGYLIRVQAYIPQERPFHERPLLEQFDYALEAFIAQEHSRATTGKHVKQIEHTFGIATPATYLTLCQGFLTEHTGDTIARELITRAYQELERGQIRLTQYGHFLTHTDFVPHNFRIHNGKLYLLDFSAIRFGNKHESWARFLNFMTLHNPALEAAFITYFKDNRATEEQESLHLMRLFRLTEIMTYYRKTLPRSSGNLKTLNEARVVFWGEVLSAMLAHEPLGEAVRTKYQTTRDSLRSEDEKKRQIGLH